MSRLTSLPTPANACGPCLSEKQLKKQREQDAKDLKVAINFLTKKSGWERDTMTVVGGLVMQLINIQGPLK